MRRKEEDLQIRCVNFLTYRYSHLLWNHSPNEGKRSDRQGATLKRMGMQPGWPDLDIVDKSLTVHIEFKSPTGRPSPEQKQMKLRVEDQLHPYYIVRTYEEFVDICHKHFGPEHDPDIEQLRKILGAPTPKK